MCAAGCHCTMAGQRTWGRKVFRDGDLVFRLGDARTLRGILPVSRFIARATGSPFSHTAIVAIDGGSFVAGACDRDFVTVKLGRGLCGIRHGNGKLGS